MPIAHDISSYPCAVVQGRYITYKPLLFTREHGRKFDIHDNDMILKLV